MRRTLLAAIVVLVACGGENATPGVADGGEPDAILSRDGAEPDSRRDASDEPSDPCSGKACGESCRSWRVNAEACDIHGECNEANLAMCTCDPCQQGCEYLHLCDGGRDAFAGDSGPGCGFIDLLDRGCASDSDCALGVHQTDCCGNTTAIGFRSTERMRFDVLEPACDRTYPGCGCPSGPTNTDSGETVFDRSQIHVGCISEGPARHCRTYVVMRPPDTP
jgi:hypothetical protein